MRTEISTAREGLEPAPAPLALARRNVVAAGLEDRIELRAQRVEELGDEEAFDVAWLPASFLSTDTLVIALATVYRALRPGGLLLTGGLDGSGTDGEAAVARLRLTLWGGDSLAPAELVAMIEAAGYVDVTAVERQSSRRAHACPAPWMMRACTTPSPPLSRCGAWPTATR